MQRPGLTVVAMLPALFWGVPLGAQAVAEVQVSPQTVTLTVGQQQGVFATAYDRNGNVVPTAQFTWRTQNPAVARVEPDNSAPGVALIIAVGEGVTQIEARSGSQSGTAAISVTGGGGAAPQIGTGTATILRIEPQNVLLLPSEQRQLIPLFLKDDGSPAAPTRITWASLNPGIATVTDGGLVTALSEGQAAIQATATGGGLSAIAPLSVTRTSFGFSVPVVSLSPGEETSVQAVVPTQGNRVLVGSALSWRSSNPAVVTVSPLGVMRAVGAGQAQVVASGFLQEQALEVRVHRPVTTMELLPGPSSGPVMVPFSGTRTFEARALAADGTPVADAPMIWTVRDTTIARFDPATNALRGLALGTTRLHLRGPGPDVLEAEWDVRVVAGGLRAAPARLGLGTRDTATVTAQFTDTVGTPISPASGHTWESSNPQVATVTAGGLVTAAGRGHAAIIASTPWGAADTAHVYVQGELIFTSTRGGAIDLWAIDRTAPGQAGRVTSDAAAEVSAAFSPDGASIAFVSTRDGNQEIYIANADGSGARRVTTTPGAEDAPVWSADGRVLYFAAAERGQRAQIHMINVDGTGRRALTQDSTATNFQPAVSPDGTTIAFTSTRDGNYEIYLMGADGSNQRNLTQTPGKESLPQWWPDGQLAYLAEQRAGDALQSVVMRRDLRTGQAGPLSPNGLMVTDFAVAPDGQMLALQVERFGSGGTIQRRLFLLPMTGGGPVEVPAAQADEQQSSPGWR